MAGRIGFENHGNNSASYNSSKAVDADLAVSKFLSKKLSFGALVSPTSR